MERTEALRHLWRQCFDDEEDYIDLFFRTAYRPDRCRTLERDGKLLAALYYLDCSCRGEKLAYLYAVGVAPEARGRGLCRALMADTHAALAWQGYAGTVLVPDGEGLRGMYRSMGYRNCGGIARWTAKAAAPLPLRQVGPEEYAALRRQLLPPGAVLQEGDSLALLAGYARLYAGEGFLLAAEEAPFTPLELLGDRAAAPGILAALGQAEAVFRGPGVEPFAMFHPLAENAQAPEYFGLAFD